MKRDRVKLKLERKQVQTLRDATMRWVPPGGMGVKWQAGDQVYDLIKMLDEALT